MSAIAWQAVAWADSGLGEDEPPHEATARASGASTAIVMMSRRTERASLTGLARPLQGAPEIGRQLGLELELVAGQRVAEP